MLAPSEKKVRNTKVVLIMEIITLLAILGFAGYTKIRAAMTAEAESLAAAQADYYLANTPVRMSGAEEPAAPEDAVRTAEAPAPVSGTADAPAREETADIGSDEAELAVFRALLSGDYMSADGKFFSFDIFGGYTGYVSDEEPDARGSYELGKTVCGMKITISSDAGSAEYIVDNQDGTVYLYTLDGVLAYTLS